MGTQTRHLKVRRWLISGVLAWRSSYGVDALLIKLGLYDNSVPAWTMASPHAVAGRFVCKSIGRAITCNDFIIASASPFCVCTCGTVDSCVIPAEAQNCSNVVNVNSPAPSKRIVFIGFSGYRDRNLRICVSNRGKAWFCVESSCTFIYARVASATTMKYLKGPQGGLMGPQISPCSLERNVNGSKCFFICEGLIWNLPCMQGEH